MAQDRLTACVVVLTQDLTKKPTCVLVDSTAIPDHYKAPYYFVVLQSISTFFAMEWFPLLCLIPNDKLVICGKAAATWKLQVLDLPSLKESYCVPSGTTLRSCLNGMAELTMNGQSTVAVSYG